MYVETAVTPFFALLHTGLILVLFVVILLLATKIKTVIQQEKQLKESWKKFEGEDRDRLNKNKENDVGRSDSHSSRPRS